MSGTVPLDEAWRAASPLPVHGDGTTKDSRGRVLLIGGSRLVPGALRLTGEAALRAGAGKLRMATIESAATALGMLVPEAAVTGLAEDDDGDIATTDLAPLEAGLAMADTIVLGPAIGASAAAEKLVRFVAARAQDDVSLVLDAAAVAGSNGLAAVLGGYAGRIVMTPHFGEMAGLMDCDEATVGDDPVAIALRAARIFRAVIVLKGTETVIAAPDGQVLHYPGGGVGLATGGSGDVLAGIVGGLLSRGATPWVAAGWAVWLHGEAGRTVAQAAGPIGFLARDLLPELPRLLPR